MKIARFTCFVAFVAACVAACLVPKLGVAQVADGTQIELDMKAGQFKRFDCELSDVVVILRKYYAAIGKLVSFAPGLKATVAINLRNHSVKSVLEHILWQAKATVEERDGVAMVRPLTQEELDEPEGRIDNLEFKNMEAQEAIRSVFKHFNASFSIEPEIKGNVTLSLKDVDFNTALRDTLAQIDATFRKEGGVYQILTQETAARPMRLTLDWSKESFESSVKILASRLGGISRVNDGKGYLLDRNGAIVAVVTQSKFRR